MPSASMTGSPVRAPTTSGIVELIPPHSIGIVASALRPRCCSSAGSEATASEPRGIFSIITVGAPIIAVGITNQSSGTSSSGTSRTLQPSSSARSTISRPMYGSPPPPVPRNAAPRARSSRSCRVSSRAMNHPEPLLDRHVVDVVAEVARPGEREPGVGAPARIARRRDHGDAEAVAELLRRDRLAGLRIEHDDQVRHRDDDLAVTKRDEMLVLEAKLERRALVGTRSL